MAACCSEGHSIHSGACPLMHWNRCSRRRDAFGCRFLTLFLILGMRLAVASLRSFSSARIGFVGLGERSSSVVERIAIRSESKDRFSYLTLSDDARSKIQGSENENMDNVNVFSVTPQLSEDDHVIQIEGELHKDESALLNALKSASESDVCFVLSDLGEVLPNGASPSICRHFRGKNVLTLGVAILPFSFGGHVLNERARRALRRLKLVCDSVFVIDSGTLRAQDLHTANFYELHEKFLDQISSNISALCSPLIRSHDLRKITLMHWRQVFTGGQEARLVTSRSISDSAENERGEMLVQAALTDEFFPLNDISECNGAIVAIEASKDLSFGEIEQVYNLQRFLERDAVLIQGLHYSETLLGIQLTLAVVGGSILTPEELKLEEEEALRLVSVAEELKIRSKGPSLVNRAEEYWKRFKQWF